MKILIDMNLTPRWVNYFVKNGFDAIHWYNVGKPNAIDLEIFEFAKNNDYIIFTHDLDFGSILASTNFESPSVIQLRTDDIMPESIGFRIINALEQFELMLKNGAIIIIDQSRDRARILPLKK